MTMTTNGERKERTKRGCLMCRLRRKRCSPTGGSGPCQCCSSLRIVCPKGYWLSRPPTMKEKSESANDIKRKINDWTTQRRSSRGKKDTADGWLDLSSLICPAEHSVPLPAPIPTENPSPMPRPPLSPPNQPSVDPGSLPVPQDGFGGLMPVFPPTLHASPSPRQIAEMALGDAVTMETSSPHAQTHLGGEGMLPGYLQNNHHYIPMEVPGRPLSPMRANMQLRDRTVNPQALLAHGPRGTPNGYEAQPTAGSSNTYGNWRDDNRERD